MATGKNTRKELSEKQLTYVVWAAQPDGVRQPATEKEFGELYAIDKVTMWRWGKDPRILDAVRYVVLQHAGDPRRVNQVLDAVFDKAIGGGPSSLKAAEIWIKAVGISSQFTRENSILEAFEDDAQFADFSDEELKRLRDEAKAAEAENERINVAKVALANRGVDVEA